MSLNVEVSSFSNALNPLSNSTKTKVFLNHIRDAHMILAFLNFPVDINDAALCTIENLDRQYLKQAEVL